MNAGGKLFVANETTFDNFSDIYASDLGLDPEELDKFREQTGGELFDVKEDFRPND